MERVIGYYAFLGLVLGGTWGAFMGTAIENTPLGIGLGAVGGLFVGWFVAVAVVRNRKK